MYLFFIRHGQSANNALYDRTGESRGRSEDPELTETGKQQALLLAEFIARTDSAASNGNQREDQEFRRDYFGFTHLYTSLMVRSIATGLPVAEVSGLPLTGWLDIHETGGIFLDDEVTGEPQGLPGRTRSYFRNHYSDLVLPDEVSESGWWNRPFEHRDERDERAARVLAELIKRHGGTNDRVAMVSHGAFYNHLMRAIFGLTGEKIWFVMNNTGITRINFHDDGQANLIYHNRTDHLTDDLLT